jgi:hypothetical protein
MAYYVCAADSVIYYVYSALYTFIWLLFVVFSNVSLVAIAGWLDCPAFGEPIDKIIPSKVPLDETFNETVPPGKRYSSKQLVTKQRKAGREVSILFLAQIIL